MFIAPFIILVNVHQQQNGNKIPLAQKNNITATVCNG